MAVARQVSFTLKCAFQKGGESLKVKDEEKADRYGIYPALRIAGKDACPEKIFDELWNRFGGQGYKFAILYDVSKDEYETPEKETLVYFLDGLLREMISYVGAEELRKELERWK